MAIEKHLRHDDWYLWATMSKGYVTMAVFQSLEAYWPGVLTLVGALVILSWMTLHVIKYRVYLYHTFSFGHKLVTFASFLLMQVELLFFVFVHELYFLSYNHTV